MRNIPKFHPGINPGPDRRPPASRRAIDPHQLDGADRRAWEESVKARPGLKGSRTLLVLVLLDMARGKPWSYPSDAYLAGKCGVSENTVWRCLRDLAVAGVIRIVKARGRRWIVFPDHPHAGAFLAGLEPAAPAVEVPAPIPPDPAPDAGPHLGIPAPHVETDGPQVGIRDPQNGERIVVVKLRDEAHHEPAPAREGGPEMSLSGANEPTTDGDPPMPSAAPRRRLRGIPDLVGAPAEDPVIAAELARRARAREAAAIPDRDAIIAAALVNVGESHVKPPPNEGIAPISRGAEAENVLVGHIIDAHQTPNGSGAPIFHGVQASPDPEAATIEALSRLGPGATRGEVLAATLRLTALFRDPSSRAFYRKTVNEVARGELPARVLVAAVGSARGPDVRNPGAAFTAHIKRVRATAEARRTREQVASP